MPTILVDDPRDPRLSPYLNLKDRDVRRERGLFLAESEHVVRRAFEAGLRVRSVLVVESKADRVRAMAEASGLEDVEVLACAKEVMAQAAGIKLHQGMIAAVEPAAEASWESLQASESSGSSLEVLVVCPEITNVDNLGLLIRVCAGLGVRAMVLGPRCADPWYRRAVRVSMGAVFTMPLIRSTDLETDLDRLRAAGYEQIATVTDADAQELREVAPGVGAGRRQAILVGSEGYGLPTDLVARCDRKVRIPMHHDVDSLNVAVATGIVIHHFTSPPRAGSGRPGTDRGIAGRGE
ncbi:MAG: RNA methyltransferase [Planctomycetota bacterium]